ncbi:hypothetical protein [Butyrivibrio sp. INlla16]|uniref:hypothetical protein n=1 Tax=Butyrivibrio sp. INlla16 TaxID=1520807 RepID=UPI00087E32F7|nr:hypothetical protein [Butyrivibrio sp. INlla16]SDB39132.1 hypothetical protein SAMN02910263_01892 [Butyrivibrio sp. INlla16]
MKLKYYLRGLGLGIVLTAVIMGIALGKRTAKMSDEEIIKRAKQLGMVEAESTLSSYSETAKNSEVIDEANNTASDSQVDEKGEEIFEEIHEDESAAGESVPEVDEKTQESEPTGESSESISAEEDVKLASDNASETASTETLQAEETGAETSETETSETETSTDEAEIAPEEASVSEAASTNDSSNESSETSQVANSSDTNYVVVVLPSGSDSDDCARILREAGIITDGVEYNNYLISTGKDRFIRSGTKQIPRGASFEEITSIITK